MKDAVPEGLLTRVVYKFSRASCNACYVGEIKESCYVYMTIYIVATI